ncbi:MAG: isocitrate dehydrogenase (NAD(+)) [Acidobacteriia bacterium]|nr:isocitrate dehydrogenase (NAD(+)) [Terriglobia bacterium]
MIHTVTLIPGDGIGPEVISAARCVIEATGVTINWEEINAGGEALKHYGTLLPDALIESIKRNRVALKGPITTQVAEGFPSLNVRLRKMFDLYANFRPIKNMPNVPCRFGNVDLMVVRENTEDLYAGLEHEVVPGVVESLKIITERASTRIARFAFDYARKLARREVCAVHKANIMKMSDGLFLNCVRIVASQYPEIKYRELIVDNTCMQLVLNPQQFDILLLENLYGDIISDLGAGLIGGLGLVPGANIGVDGAIFEAVHGSAPDIAGKGVANPTAVMLSSALLLEHLNELEAGRRLRSAIEGVYAEGKHITRDLGGTATTQEFTEAVLRQIDSI